MRWQHPLNPLFFHCISIFTFFLISSNSAVKAHPILLRAAFFTKFELLNDGLRLDNDHSLRALIQESSVAARNAARSAEAAGDGLRKSLEASTLIPSGNVHTGRESSATTAIQRDMDVIVAKRKEYSRKLRELVQEIESMEQSSSEQASKGSSQNGGNVNTDNHNNNRKDKDNGLSNEYNPFSRVAIGRDAYRKKEPWIYSSRRVGKVYKHRLDYPDTTKPDTSISYNKPEDGKMDTLSSQRSIDGSSEIGDTNDKPEDGKIDILSSQRSIDGSSEIGGEVYRTIGEQLFAMSSGLESGFEEEKGRIGHLHQDKLFQEERSNMQERERQTRTLESLDNPELSNMGLVNGARNEWTHPDFPPIVFTSIAEKIRSHDKTH